MDDINVRNGGRFTAPVSAGELISVIVLRAQSLAKAHDEVCRADHQPDDRADEREKGAVRGAQVVARAAHCRTEEVAAGADDVGTPAASLAQTRGDAE